MSLPAESRAPSMAPAPLSMRLLRDIAWLPPCIGDSIWTHRHHFFAFPYFLLAERVRVSWEGVAARHADLNSPTSAFFILHPHSNH